MVRKVNSNQHHSQHSGSRDHARGHGDEHHHEKMFRRRFWILFIRCLIDVVSTVIVAINLQLLKNLELE